MFPKREMLRVMFFRLISAVTEDKPKLLRIVIIVQLSYQVKRHQFLKSINRFLSSTFSIVVQDLERKTDTTER